MKKLFFLIIFLGCCLISSATTKEGKKTIKIVGDKYAPPYEYLNREFEPIGFNVDLIKEIMERLDQPYVIELGVWDDVLDSLKNGNADLIIGMVYFNDRANEYSFGAVHSFLDYSLVAKKDAVIRKISDLEGKNILVQKGRATDILLKNKGVTSNIIYIDNIRDGITRMLDGEACYMLCPGNIARWFIPGRGEGQINIYDAGLSPREYRFASNDNDLLNTINKEFYNLKADGTYDIIYNNWFQNNKQDLTPLYIIIFVIIISFTVAYIFLYKLRIKSKNDLLIEYKKNNLIFDTAAIGLLLCDKDGFVIRINDVGCNIFRIKSAKSVIDAGYSLHQNPFLKKYISGDTVSPFDGVIKYDTRYLKDGFADGKVFNRFDVFYLKTKISPIYNNSGKLENIVISMLDVSDLFNAQEKMLDSRENLFVALEAGSLSVWLYNVKDNVFSALGGDPILADGMTMDDNLALLYPSEINEMINTFTSLCDGSVKKVDKIFRYKNSSGGYFHYECKIISKVVNGSVKYLLGIQKDITEDINKRYLLENQIKMTQFAIKASNIAFIIYDCEKGHYITYNDPVNDYAQDSIISWEDYRSLIHPLDLHLMKDRENTILNGLNKSYEASVRMKYKPDGVYKYITIMGGPFEIGEDGKVKKFVGFRRDDTEAMLIQQKLKSEKEKAEQADKLKSAFLANMSHEIRTPLNAIVGFSSLLENVEDPQEKSEFIKIIQVNNQLLLRLVNDILELSKIESGIIDLKPTMFDAEELFHDFYHSTVSSLENKNVRIELITPGLSKLIKIDQNRVIQILNNFTSNAIKYTPRGNIYIGYTIEDNGIKLFVKDTGKGIPASKHNRVFQRFEKLDSFEQGTGLGLTICKAIVDAKKGRIWFESQENEGSTFYAWMPFAD